MVEVVIKPLPNEGKYQLMEDYEFTVLDFKRKIEKGFKFDGASIPRAFWTLLGVTPFHAKIIIPALIHDYIYDKKCLQREIADKVFKYLLEQNGFKARAWIMYQAVRLFGGLHWK